MSDDVFSRYGSFDMSQRMTKPTKWHVRRAKTQSDQSSLSAWRKFWSLATTERIDWADAQADLSLR